MKTCIKNKNELSTKRTMIFNIMKLLEKMFNKISCLIKTRVMKMYGIGGFLRRFGKMLHFFPKFIFSQNLLYRFPKN